MNMLAFRCVAYWAHSLSRYDECDCNASESGLGIADPFLTGGSVYYGIMDEAVSHNLFSS